MATVATIDVTERDVVGERRTREVVAVARNALDVEWDKTSDFGAFVATAARSRGVGSGQREACFAVQIDGSLGMPSPFAVAVLATRTERSDVDVLVATGAAAFSEVGDGTAVVVTT